MVDQTTALNESQFHYFKTFGYIVRGQFLTPAQQICGEDVPGIGIDANRYVGNTGGHPDRGNRLQIAVKYIFYLDSVTADTGA